MHYQGALLFKKQCYLYTSGLTAKVLTMRLTHKCYIEYTHGYTERIFWDKAEMLQLLFHIKIEKIDWKKEFFQILYSLNAATD